MYEEKPTQEEKREADRRAQEEQQVIHVIQTARGRFVCSADELLREHPEESFYSIYTARPPTSHPGAADQEEEAQPGQADKDQEAFPRVVYPGDVIYSSKLD